MKINRAALPVNESVKIQKDIDFSMHPSDEHHIRKIDKCRVKVILKEYEDVLECKLSGTAEVVTSCSYTLDDIVLKIKFKEDFYFSNNKTSRENVEYEPGSIIDLEPYILALICDSVPHKITKPGASLPSSGEGYRVLTEDDFFKERQIQTNPVFDVLDQIELPSDDE
ncbi:MAG TPA: hypothetical protein GX010_00650 [Erysipelotrichaceae bacterium]|nr:hypothetical protein [Erysipelotrichaceae bacterium]